MKGNITNAEPSANAITNAIATVVSLFNNIGLPAEAATMKHTMLSFYKANDMVSFMTEYLRYKFLFQTFWRFPNFASQLLYEISILPFNPDEKAIVAASILPDLKQHHYKKALELLYTYDFPVAKALYIETFSMGASNCMIKILEKNEPKQAFSNVFLKVASCIDKIQITDWTFYPYTDSKAIYRMLNRYLSDHNFSILPNGLTNVVEISDQEEPAYCVGSTCIYTNTYIKKAIIL